MPQKTLANLNYNFKKWQNNHKLKIPSDKWKWINLFGWVSCHVMSFNVQLSHTRIIIFIIIVVTFWDIEWDCIASRPACCHHYSFSISFISSSSSQLSDIFTSLSWASFGWLVVVVVVDFVFGRINEKLNFHNFFLCAFFLLWMIIYYIFFCIELSKDEKKFDT